MTLADLLAENRAVLLDGGMGRILQGMGLAPGQPPEMCNLAHPEQVEALHRAYVDAGAQVLYTNTLAANGWMLERHGLAGRHVELNQAAVRLARSAAGDRALVAGDLSSTGEFLEPLGSLKWNDAVILFLEQAAALAEVGVDLFVIETMIDLAEVRAAIVGVRAASRVPILCTLTFGPNGRTLMGARPAAVAQELADLGVAAVGANCSTGAVGMLPVVAEMAAATSLPIIAKPNAGMPQMVGGETVYPDGPDEMAEGIRRLVDAGARLVGGCCGSTPAHIHAMAALR